jgi:uncharacterized membrane-anchored protein
VPDTIPPDHPYRAALMDEVHARPVDLIPQTCRLRRLVFVMPPEAGAMTRLFDGLRAFCAGAGRDVPEAMGRQYSFDAGSLHVTWEFHTEFVTVTWRGGLGDNENWPGDVGLAVVARCHLIGAVRIDVIAETTIPERLMPGFNLASLCLADIEGGGAQVATDFRPDVDTYTRYELAAGDLTQLRRSVIVRRLLEVETYRTMALLGLPLAREIAPELGETEIALTRLIEQLPAARTHASFQDALIELHALSVRSGQISERLSYRFAAGRAYGDVLRARLDGLREKSTVRGSTLTHYIGNRVNPALATCAALEKRLEVLSAKLERAIGLLEVRLGVDMQKQNASLLDSIAQTTRSQFLLQRTVEGLSTIAITYYLLGIVSYGLAGWLEELHWPKTLVVSISTPFMLALVWFLMRRVKKLHGA